RSVARWPSRGTDRQIRSAHLLREAHMSDEKAARERCDKNEGFGTRAIHAGQPPDPQTGAVMTPIYQTSTFAQRSPGQHRGYEYSRTDNPTRTAYQACLASLEDARWALAFSSGLAATDALLHTLKAGDHVLASDDLYGGTFRIFDKVFKRLGLEFS